MTESTSGIETISRDAALGYCPKGCDGKRLLIERDPATDRTVAYCPYCDTTFFVLAPDGSFMAADDWAAFERTLDGEPS